MDALIVSQRRLLAESLKQALQRDPFVAVSEICFTLESAAERILEVQPYAVLLDSQFPGGPRSCRSLLGVASDITPVVFELSEAADEISGWVEAGIAGYITQTTAFGDFTPLLLDIMRGAQVCTGSVTAAVLRRACGTGRELAGAPTWTPPLTVRDLQLMTHLTAGAENGELCRRLNVDPLTLQALIRDLMHKLGLRRRADIVLWAVFVAQGARSAEDVARRIAAIECDECVETFSNQEQHIYVGSNSDVLTEREIEVMRWTARGKTAFEISVILKLTERTINFHIGRVLSKLGAINKTEAAVRCAAMGLL